MSNRRNHRRRGRRRYEKGRKTAKVSARVADATRVRLATDRKRREQDAAWSKWMKSADYKRWKRHGRWKQQRKGSKGLKKKRIREREKMIREQNRWFAAEASK